ncbi:GNAT family N-acetyltransferase [Mammaliicoccus sciuri]|uniref:GNAT family N-acetyltransferase n=1 Tax=Mammaliicoccus sciuri TaxID=1296 RepID=UPI000CD1E699|nr:GNAT family N-acetyltransferase [Mammaliicoccus sciuri]PNZ24130.1 GNAT family N-acetyltransferase [Mammaliicoccus sciuri]
MAIYTRLFEEKDFNQIDYLLQLYNELGYPTTRKDLIHRLTKINNHKDYYMMLLFEDEKIIGFSGMCKMMFYENNGDYMRILAFVINSNFRQYGLGSFLLNESEKMAEKLNCKAMTLTSGIRIERENAHKFYISNGFECTSYGFFKNML